MDGQSARSTKLLLGIDEAGYGPNFGPLVVVAASLEVPDHITSESLWDVAHPTVTRFPAESPDDIVIDDSKRVYSGGTGLDCLERTVFAWIGQHDAFPRTLRQLWNSHCLTPSADIDEGPCFEGQDLKLPHTARRETLDQAADALRALAARAGFGRTGIVCQIIMPRRFNQLVIERETKNHALFQVNVELLRHFWDHARPCQIEAVLDKHGGRNFYGSLLQEEFQETVVLSRRESADVSDYAIRTRSRSLEATFMPRADGSHLLVALASMTAKYLREMWMLLFNRYWSSHISDLRPTAGYPTDSGRFWNTIEPTVHRLGIRKELLWRER
jgi:ribonuclease HII